MPPAATAKTLAAEFARHLGVPITDRMTQAQITNAVCHVHGEAGVRLVMIDEIHRRGPRTTAGAETADLLKDLTERTGATFVYAGIDVTATPLFAEARGAQLAGRASLVECGAFPARCGWAEPFLDLIAAMENALDLQHTPRAGRVPTHTGPGTHRRPPRTPPSGGPARRPPVGTAPPPQPGLTRSPGNNHRPHETPGHKAHQACGHPPRASHTTTPRPEKNPQMPHDASIHHRENPDRSHETTKPQATTPEPAPRNPHHHNPGTTNPPTGFSTNTRNPKPATQPTPPLKCSAAGGRRACRWRTSSYRPARLPRPSPSSSPATPASRHGPDDAGTDHRGRLRHLPPAGLRMVLIDEIHRFNRRTTTRAETADLLKRPHRTRIGVTFAYAGIDVTATPSFGDVRGARPARRAPLLECGAFPRGSAHASRSPS